MKKSNRKSFRCFVGLDLAAIEHRPTGFCLLMGMHVRTKILYTDTEILEEIVNSNPVMVAIDAPLTLPKGRCCLKDDCTCRGNGHLRECDRAVRRLGIPIFALSLGSMRILTIRGMRIRDQLVKEKIPVIETYPGGAQDILGIPRQKDPTGLRKGLRRFGIEGDIKRRKIGCHELDAITCALVAKEHETGRSLILGDPNEGLMVLTGSTLSKR